MKKIKILHIIKSLGRGGAEMLLPETLKMHDKSKFEFHYMFFLPWKDQMVGEIERVGGKVTCLQAGNNLAIFLKYKKIIDYCKNHEIDILHCHLPWAGFVGRFVHFVTGIPMFYTEHNMQERYHVVTKVLNKFSFNSQTLAFGVSDNVTKSIEKNIKPKIPVRTVSNGVNTNSFLRKESVGVREQYNIPSGAVVIGNIAVFRFQKRLKNWLWILHKICKNNKNVYGIIVGSGPLEKEIKEEFKKLNLEGRVFFAGLQTNVKPYLEAMDIFMMTSSFEGLPVALLEAMSMECAVVATEAGGIKEVVRDKKDGYTCEVDQWKLLEEMIQHLIDKPKVLKEFKTAARKRVENKFSLQVMVGKLEQFYLNAVSKNVEEN